MKTAHSNQPPHRTLSVESAGKKTNRVNAGPGAPPWKNAAQNSAKSFGKHFNLFSSKTRRPALQMDTFDLFTWSNKCNKKFRDGLVKNFRRWFFKDFESYCAPEFYGRQTDKQIKPNIFTWDNQRTFTTLEYWIYLVRKARRDISCQQHHEDAYG